MRWDNTLRYNLGQRTQGQDKAILANPNFDDGDRNFSNHSLIANRLDLLSEFDLVVDKKYGFRVSGTAWYDNAYTSLDNRNNATANTLVYGVPTAGALSDYTARYAKGPSGELLDAFVFGSRTFGETDVSLRLGKHTVYWGESLLGAGAIHGISYGQYSLDLWKALATPGIEAKEIYRPRNSLTLQAQPSPELSFSAQTFFDWESVRYPESGSYLTVNDALLHGGDSLIAGPGQRLGARLRAATRRRPATSACPRAGARSGSTALPGVYGRRTADIQPQLALLPAVAAGVPAAACTRAGLRPIGPSTCYINPGAATLPQVQAGYVGQYQAFYGRDIDMYGLQPLEEHRGRERRGRTQLPQQHAAAERASAGVARGAGQSGDRLDLDGAVRPVGRRCARRARQHRPRRVQLAGNDVEDAALRQRHLERRAGVEPLAERLAEPRRLQGQRGLPRERGQRRRGQQGLLRPGPRTSRPPGTRCSRAWTCRCR